MEDVTFRPCLPGDAPARDLLAAMVDELVEMYDIPAGVRPGVPLDPEELGPPGGSYLVGWVDGVAVAGGGVRTIGDGVGEIKRMYVDPGWRSRGLARRLLAALEDESRRLGLAVVRLDTGAKQAGAQHLYESAGYAPIGNYNGNGHAAFWGEKRL